MSLSDTARQIRADKYLHLIAKHGSAIAASRAMGKHTTAVSSFFKSTATPEQNQQYKKLLQKLNPTQKARFKKQDKLRDDMLKKLAEGDICKASCDSSDLYILQCLYQAGKIGRYLKSYRYYYTLDTNHNALQKKTETLTDRYLKAITDHGSVEKAAKALGRSAQTIYRYFCDRCSAADKERYRELMTALQLTKRQDTMLERLKKGVIRASEFNSTELDTLVDLASQGKVSRIKRRGIFYYSLKGDSGL